MQPQAPDVELRLSELQTQIDRLSLALNQWHPESEYPTHSEERLSQLLERCTETLTRVTAIDERHTKAVAQLEARLKDWSLIESRLEQDSDQRIRQFERIIEHETQALLKIHEEPARQLREQAASLGETCIAAANLALRSFERAEERFAELEAGMQSKMTQLAAELQVVVTALRGGLAPPPALPGDVTPFPLESVMRIHEELRRSDDGGDAAGAGAHLSSAAGASAAARVKTGLQLPEAAAQLSDRMASLERAVSSGQEEARVATARTEGIWRAWRTSSVVAAVVVVGAMALAVWLQRRVEGKLNEADARVAAAERQAETATALASKRITETQADADRKLAEARETALRAQIVSSVLAAPDLVRFNLAGGSAAPRAYAQILWSRSHGLVFSASRLPPPRQGATYQLWLITSGAAISAGLVTPDSLGRATLATDNPPDIPRPVLTAVLTLEPSGGRPRPMGDTILARAR